MNLFTVQKLGTKVFIFKFFILIVTYWHNLLKRNPNINYLVKKRWIPTLKAKPVRPTPLITPMLTVMLTMSGRKLMEFVEAALNQFGYLLMILLIQVSVLKVSLID